jgi:pyruvate, water dikinase
MNEPILTGIGVSRGTARGKVKIISSINDHEKFDAGDILVVNITDPTMVTLMAKSGAIVCNIGSITSHPSIVSRELGVPCVVNTKEATTILKDGMEVVVDGLKGKIFLQ